MHGHIQKVLAGIILLFCLAWSNTHAREQQLLLDILFNGQRLNRIGEFKEQSGQIYARISEWRDYGIAIPPAMGADSDSLSSNQLPNVSVKVDHEKLLVWIDVKPEHRPVNQIQLEHCCEATAANAVTSAQGVVLNYDLLAQRYSGRQAVSAALDGRFFGPGWIAGSTGIYLGQFDRPARFIRLDSQYTWLDPGRMSRIIIGDFINQSVSWSRSVRMGGLRLSSDFSMRPDLITFPVPSLRGLATVPSTVDVLVNNVRLLSNPVEPGPFEIRQLPVFSGAGNVNLVVRDALGRETVQTVAFYASPQMLAPGLSSFSVEIGKLRSNYGLQSNDYSTPTISTTYRKGLHERATLEAHAEGARGLALGGGSLIWNFGALGMATGSFAYSENQGQNGALFGFNYERQANPFSFSAAFTQTSDVYADLATRLGQSYPKRTTRFFAGWSLQRWGNLSMGYNSNTDFTSIRRNETSGLASGQLVSPNRTGSLNKLLTLSYTRTIFNDGTFYLTWFRNKSDGPTDEPITTRGRTITKGFMFGFTLTLDNRTSSSLTHTNESRGSSSNLSINRPAIDPGDLGWRLYGQSGFESRFLGAMEYKSNQALMRLSVDQSQGRKSLQGELSGALGRIGSQVFTSNRIDDSFAMVDTNLPHMRVLIENRDAGQSNANGRLLVPNLRAYDVNTVSFDTRQLTLDYALETTNYQVRPQERSGTFLRFDVRSEAVATATLARESGAILEPGSIVEYGHPKLTTVVGFSGKVYLRQLTERNQLTVHTPSGDCHAEFSYTPMAGTIPELGRILCH